MTVCRLALRSLFVRPKPGSGGRTSSLPRSYGTPKRAREDRINRQLQASERQLAILTAPRFRSTRCARGPARTDRRNTGSRGPPADCDAFPVRLGGPRWLDAPPAKALARLRIFEHRIPSVKPALSLKVVGVGRGPAATQSRSNLSVLFSAASHSSVLKHTAGRILANGGIPYPNWSPL